MKPLDRVKVWGFIWMVLFFVILVITPVWWNPLYSVFFFCGAAWCLIMNCMNDVVKDREAEESKENQIMKHFREVG